MRIPSTGDVADGPDGPTVLAMNSLLIRNHGPRLRQLEGRLRQVRDGSARSTASGPTGCSARVDDPHEVQVVLDFDDEAAATEFRGRLEQIRRSPQSQAQLVSHEGPVLLEVVGRQSW